MKGPFFIVVELFWKINSVLECNSGYFLKYFLLENILK
jgi:hypothetical protein